MLRVAEPRRPESWLIASNHLQERSPASACTRRLVTLAAVDACVRAFVDVCRWERESTRGRARLCNRVGGSDEQLRLPQSFLRLFFFYSDSLSVSFQRKMKGVVHTGWFFWNFFLNLLFPELLWSVNFTFEIVVCFWFWFSSKGFLLGILESSMGDEMREKVCLKLSIFCKKLPLRLVFKCLKLFFYFEKFFQIGGFKENYNFRGCLWIWKQILF